MTRTTTMTSTVEPTKKLKIVLTEEQKLLKKIEARKRYRKTYKSKEKGRIAIRKAKRNWHNKNKDKINARRREKYRLKKLALKAQKQLEENQTQQPQEQEIQSED